MSNLGIISKLGTYKKICNDILFLYEHGQQYKIDRHWEKNSIFFYFISYLFFYHITRLIDHPRMSTYRFQNNSTDDVGRYPQCAASASILTTQPVVLLIHT